MRVDPTIVQTTLLCFILSLCFQEAKNPPPPYLFNSTLGRFHGNLVSSTSWHLPTPVPLANVIGRSEAAFLWNTTPSSSSPYQQNSTATNSTNKKVYKFFNDIHPIVAISNASSWDISETGLFNATTVLTTTSPPIGSITSSDPSITLLSAIEFFSSSFKQVYKSYYNNTTTLQNQRMKVVPLPKVSLLTSIFSYFCHHPTMRLKSSSPGRIKGDTSSSSWDLSAPAPLADLPWNSLPNLHSSTITATVEFRIISATATSNFTDTENAQTNLIRGFVNIYPVVDISNASSWNMSETDVLAATKIPSVIILPCSTLTSPAMSIAFQDIEFISPSFLLPHVVFSRCGITSLEADAYSSSNSSHDPPCHADIVTHTTHNISLIHEYFDLLASAMFYNAFVLNSFFFSLSIYFIFHFHKQDVEIPHNIASTTSPVSSLTSPIVLASGPSNDDFSSLYGIDDEGDDANIDFASSAASVLPVVECSIPRRRRSARIAAMEHVCYKKFF
jgi:hypothetical protein